MHLGLVLFTFWGFCSLCNHGIKLLDNYNVKHVQPITQRGLVQVLFYCLML